MPAPAHLSTTARVLGSPVRNLVSILLFMAAVIVVATLAYMAAGWSFADASYMVMLTVYTVGYGEVHPIDTPYLHAVTMGLMVLGCTGMILLTSALVQLFTVMQLRELLDSNRMQDRIEKLRDHVIICGYGRIGLMLAQDLTAARTPFLILERDAAKLEEVRAAGYLALAGDATEEEALTQAGIARAATLATVLPNDAANVFITLSARNLNPKLHIIARGEAVSTEGKLIHAGADQVVLPTRIGARRISRLILFPDSGEIKDGGTLERMARDFGDLGLRLERVAIAPRSTMDGLTVEQAERRAGGAIFVVQIDRGEAGVISRPDPHERLAADDKVMVVARRDAVDALTLFGRRAEVRAGRNVF